MLVILLVSLVFVFVNMDGDETRQEETTLPAYTELGEPVLEDIEPEFKISNMKFASVVDDNLNYQEIPATFNRGDEFWLYFEVNNLKSGEVNGRYRTVYDEYIAVNDPQGNPVEELTGFLGTTPESAEEGKYYSFPIAHLLVTSEDDLPGRYDLTIFVDDTVNEESIATSVSYILR